MSFTAILGAAGVVLVTAVVIRGLTSRSGPIGDQDPDKKDDLDPPDLDGFE